MKFTISGEDEQEWMHENEPKKEGGCCGVNAIEIKLAFYREEEKVYSDTK